MIEQWKNIEGYKDYFVSNTSKIKSVKGDREKVLKPFKSKNPNAYYEVYLSQYGNVGRAYIHRLVAKAFIPNPLNKQTVNHLNGIKTDNRLENLEWCTHKENSKHAVNTGLSPHKGETSPMAKLTQREVDLIRREYMQSNLLQKHIAKVFGVSVPTISMIINNKTWRETNL